MGDDKKEILIVNEQTLRDKVFVVRGRQVMLDSDLAVIYGYEVKTLNQQVKRNIERFPSDFMFQLTKDEAEHLKSHFVTSSWGGVRKLPYVFTEQGIYQLATVLKGELAVQQSIAIMRVFKAMREYLQGNNFLLPYQEIIRLSNGQMLLENKVKDIKDTMVTKAELSDFMKLFDNGVQQEEILILDGQPFKADIAYQKIYGRAKRKLVIIDDYISAKTLHHLAHAKANVVVNIISDNKGNNPLRLSEFQDFQTEYTGRNVTFTKTAGMCLFLST